MNKKDHRQKMNSAVMKTQYIWVC